MNYLKKVLLLVMALTLFNSPLWCMEEKERNADWHDFPDLLGEKLVVTDMALYLYRLWKMSLRGSTLFIEEASTFFRDSTTTKPIDIKKITRTMLVIRQCIKERAKQFDLNFPNDTNNYIADIVSFLTVQDILGCNFKVKGQLSDPTNIHFKFNSVLKNCPTKYVNGIAFSPNSKIIVTISEDREACLWDAKNGALKQQLRGYSAALRSVAFSPNSKIVAIGSDDTTVGLWEVETGRPLYRLTGSSSSILSITFNHDGTKVLAGSKDNAAYLWDVGTGELIKTLKHSGPVSSVAFSPVDSTKVLIGSWDGKAYLWDIETKNLLASLLNHSDKIRSAAFSPDGAIIVTVSDDKTICVWDAKTGNFLQKLSGDFEALSSVIFSPDGNIFVTVSAGSFVTLSAGNIVCLWNAKTRTLIKQLTDISSVAVSPDSKTIVTVLYDGTVCLWDAKTGELLLKLQKLGFPVTGPLVAFSPDGTTIVTVSYDGESHILKKESCEEAITTWILSKATFPQRLLIIIAAEKDRTDKGCIITKGSFDCSIFEKMPDYVQKCLIEWYSIKPD